MNTIPFSIVHHANQYLITNGYANREGLAALIGTSNSGQGYLKILELHKAYQIPLNLHLSGTLLEAIVWHCPDFLASLIELKQQGLLELVGSCYGQNIMRFYSHEHNLKQLNEELQLYREHLRIHPHDVQVLWPPERVWDTEKLGPVLTDPELLNGGYQYALIDDRLLYPVTQGSPTRFEFDHSNDPHYEDFTPHRILDRQELIALPIANVLRQNIPPRNAQSMKVISALFRWLAAVYPQAEYDLIAIYADDLEKTAGVAGWDDQGPSQYEDLLKWINENRWIRMAKLSDWASIHRSVPLKNIEVGTFVELGNHFGAGEGYEKWYFDSRWDAYRSHVVWSEGRVKELNALDSDSTLIDLAWKQLLTSSWETAWHTPTSGVHGDSSSHGGPSPWSKALASHSGIAVIIAEAAYWMKHQDGEAHAYLIDIDNNGEEELILKNDKVFAVFSPAWGGRLVYLFSVDGDQGSMVIGNPCDDWNWMEETHKYMEIPRNHPGALTDIGCEHDQYHTEIQVASGTEVRARLINNQPGSPIVNAEKALGLSSRQHEIQVNYRLPEQAFAHTIECGLSPDYLELLRFGHRSLTEFRDQTTWGYANKDVRVWLRIEDGEPIYFTQASPQMFGHGHAIRAIATKQRFTVWIGSLRFKH